MDALRLVAPEAHVTSLVIVVNRRAEQLEMFKQPLLDSEGVAAAGGDRGASRPLLQHRCSAHRRAPRARRFAVGATPPLSRRCKGFTMEIAVPPVLSRGQKKKKNTAARCQVVV